MKTYEEQLKQLKNTKQCIGCDPREFRYSGPDSQWDERPAINMRHVITCAIADIEAGIGHGHGFVLAYLRRALAQPLRNCDMYATEADAWYAFSSAREGPDSSTEEYEQWLFEPAEK